MANRNLYDLNLNIAMDIAELTKNSTAAANKIDGMEKRFSGTLATIKTSWLAWSAVAVGALKLVTEQMKSTEGGADKLEEITASLKGAMQGLNSTIASGDWGSLIKNMNVTAEAARNLKVAQDQLEDITASDALKMSILGKSLADLRLQIAATSNSTEKAELIRQAIDTQREITEIEKSQQQKRIDNYKEYYNKIMQMDPIFTEAFNREMPKIAANWRLFGDEGFQESMRIREAQLEYYKGTSLWTEAVAKENNQLRLTRTIISEIIKLRDKLSDPGKFNEFIGEFTKLNNIIQQGDENLIRLQKTLTGTEDKLNKSSKRSPLEADELWASLVNPMAEPVLPKKSYEVGGWHKGEYTKSIIFANPEELAKTKKASTTVEKNWTESLSNIGDAIYSVAQQWSSLGDAIASAMEDGSISFAEGMNIIMQTSLAAIGVLQALAVAGVFAGESWKGIAGVLAAVAGAALIISTIASVIPKNSYALGTQFASGGLSLVGENGPELVNLPRGTQVYSNLQSRSMMASHITVDGVIRGKDIALALRRAE